MISLIRHAARAARAAWQESLAGRAAARLSCLVRRTWLGSRLRDAAGRPVRALPPGRAGAVFQGLLRGAGAALAALRRGYLASREKSRGAAWAIRVASQVAARPLWACGLGVASIPLGYLASQRWVLALVPWLRGLDLGAAQLGPTGLGRSVSPLLWAGALAAGVVLAAAGWWAVPDAVGLGRLLEGSWFAATVSRVLYLETDSSGKPARGDGSASGGEGAAGAGRPPEGRAAGPITSAALAIVATGLAAGAALYVLPVIRWVMLLAGAAGLGLLLLNTEWYLIAVAAAAPFLSSELLVVALLGGFVSLLLRLAVAPDKLGKAGNPAAGPLLLFLAVAVFATVTSVSVRGSLPDLAINGAAVLFVLAMVSVSNRPGVPLRLAAGAGVGVAFQGLLGMYQYAAGIPVEKAWVDLAQASYLKVRVLGSFGNPNVLAEYLVILLPLLVGMFFAAPALLERLTWLGAAGVGGLALVLTFSRGGWAGLAVAALVFTVLYDRRLLVILLVAVLVVVSLPAGQNLILRRLQSIVTASDSSSVYRVAVWRETVGMIRDFWPSGVGLGHRAYMLMYPQYMLDRTKRPYHAHNTYLELLAETGILGLLAFAWLVWRLFRSSLAGLRALARRPGGPAARALKALTAGGLAALAGALVHGLVEPLIYIPRVTFTFWFLAGMLLCLAKVSTAESARASDGPPGARGTDRGAPAAIAPAVAFAGEAG